MKARTSWAGWRVEIAISIALAAAFFLLYLAIAESYRGVPGYAEYRNTFFGADHNEAVSGWVAYHKGVHPLVLLLVVPVGRAMELIFGSYESGIVVAAAGFGGLAVGLVFWVVRGLVGRPVLAAIVTAFFGLSMSQLVFASLPDTYEISVVSLVPTYLLTLRSLQQGRLRLAPWIGAGVLSFAITITNVVQTVLCLLVVVHATRPKGERVAPLARFVGAVGALALALALLQSWIFPEAELFLAPNTYAHEMDYVEPLILEDPFALVTELARSFLVYNFVGQLPRVADHEPGRRVELVYFEKPWAHDPLAWSALLLWLGLLGRGLWVGGGTEPMRRFRVAAGLAVASNVALHAVYASEEVFLYSPHFTTAVLYLALSDRAAAGRLTVAAWLLLALLAGANNLLVVRQIVAAFAG